MSIDAYVLLRVRDRAAFREALDAHAAAERTEWEANGNRGDYEEHLREGDGEELAVHPLFDGSVTILTRLRFTDHDVDFAIRWWLDEHFGKRLSLIHDDPRGVFIYPDICEPRSTTYEGILKELASAGRFIDPSPPTEEEHLTRRRKMDAYVDGMRAVEAAATSHDELALGRALAAAPQEVRDAWEERDHMLDRVATMMGLDSEMDFPPPSAEGSADGAGGAVIDFKSAAARLQLRKKK